MRKAMILSESHIRLNFKTEFITHYQRVLKIQSLSVIILSILMSLFLFPSSFISGFFENTWSLK